MIKNFYFFIIAFFFLSSCKPPANLLSGTVTNTKTKSVTDLFVRSMHDANDTTFVNLEDYSKEFIYDIKYATSDNFLKEKVYECASCYLRLKTVKSLISANNEFKLKGYTIKIFDCYRPLDIQKKMWNMVPNSNYVADPKKGSIHNRGGAVDITLINENGEELDMGTLFDYFGPEAAHSYSNLPEGILQNRKLLKDIMVQNNFISFDSEWWHYNLKDGNLDKISNFKWTCKE
jgi:D-alanyl-D-alanine dipeptidase